MASTIRRPNGSWRARYRDEAGKEHSRHFPRKLDAQRWLDEVTTSLVSGTYVDPGAGQITFAQFYAQWAERQIWVPSTHKAMAIAAGSLDFDGLALRELRPSHFESWIKAMSARGLAASTIRTRVNNVRAVLAAAVRDRRIASDPSAGVPLPRQRKAERAMRLPTSSEVATLLGAASEDFAPMIALAAFAGLRAGEVAGVQLGDINFLGRTLDVRRQVQREAGAEIEVRAPKYGSERTIYLPDALVTMLATHVARHGLADPTAWLFAYKSGPVTQNVITKRWGTVRAKTTLRNVRFHDLRHHCASGLIASGCDVVAVQRHLGHASATTTLNTYSHLWPTAEDRTRRAAADLMRAATDPPADSPRTQVEKISL